MSFNNKILVAESVTKQVTSPAGDLTILSDISFVIQRGESVSITGPSGAGKSTLLGLLAGLDIPTSGRIFLNDNDLTVLDEDGRAGVRAKSVGFVFQSFHLVASLNALENIMLPLELNKHPLPRERAMEVLQKVGLIERRLHYPSQLSGGEKQRVAIARAFSTEPSLLFADEPTGNLDTATGSSIIDILFELNMNSTTTLILVTHNQSIAARCNREICLNAGNLVSSKSIT